MEVGTHNKDLTGDKGSHTFGMLLGMLFGNVTPP